MKISREKPCQRRHHRVKTPLSIYIDGIDYNVVDWGLGGFCIYDWEQGDLLPGDNLNYAFNLPFQGFDISFKGTAEIVRINPNETQMAAKFCDLTERQTELLSHFIEELVRGTMTSVGDTILRIDSPVTPVSTTPDPSPANEVPAKRWSSKLILMSTLYFTAGASLLTYIIFTLYANFFSLEVESGVVSAPIERIFSTADGRIQRVSANINKLVSSGAPLIEIEDAKIEELISLANIRIERGRALLESRREELTLEQDKLNDYRNFVEQNLEEARLRVESLSKQVKLANSDLNRYKALSRSGAVSDKQYDEAIRLYTALNGTLKIAKVSLQKQKDTLTAVGKGRYFTGERFEGRVKELKTEVNRVKQEVTLTTQELLALYQRRERLTLYAATPGRIVQIVKTTGSSTKRGETIALFERDEQRVIEVFLTQQEIIGVKLHNPARAYFPALDRVVTGQIIAIDRTEGFLHEKESRYSWRASEERTAKVTLAFVNLTIEQIRNEFKPGLPAIVIFPKLSSGALGDFIRSFKSHLKQDEPIKHPDTGTYRTTQGWEGDNVISI
jgi:multidrug resistance efflux pump